MENPNKFKWNEFIWKNLEIWLGLIVKVVYSLWRSFREAV